MFITIVGLNHYMGIESIKPGDELFLKKDIENKYDDEAIKIVGNRDVTYGYVANSVESVARGTHSAGYVYGSIKEDQRCKVSFILENSVIAELI